jgi:hypothetical protein
MGGCFKGYYAMEDFASRNDRGGWELIPWMYAGWIVRAASKKKNTSGLLCRNLACWKVL